METTLAALPLPTENEGRGFLSVSSRALLQPARFFRTEISRFTPSEAIALGMGNAWLAGLLSFFFGTLNAVVVASVFDRWVQRLVSADGPFHFLDLSAKGFLWEAGLLLLAPFFLLLRAAVGSILVLLFSRLLIEESASAPDRITYASAARIQGISLVSQWLLVVPFLGGVLAFVVHLVLLTFGVRERYRVSTRRAAAVVLAPYVFLALLVLLFTACALFLISQIPFAEMLDPATMGFSIPSP